MSRNRRILYPPVGQRRTHGYLSALSEAAVEAVRLGIHMPESVRKELGMSGSLSYPYDSNKVQQADPLEQAYLLYPEQAHVGAYRDTAIVKSETESQVLTLRERLAAEADKAAASVDVRVRAYVTEEKLEKLLAKAVSHGNNSAIFNRDQLCEHFLPMWFRWFVIASVHEASNSIIKEIESFGLDCVHGPENSKWHKDWCFQIYWVTPENPEESATQRYLRANCGPVYPMQVAWKPSGKIVECLCIDVGSDPLGKNSFGNILTSLSICGEKSEKYKGAVFQPTAIHTDFIGRIYFPNIVYVP